MITPSNEIIFIISIVGTTFFKEHVFSYFNQNLVSFFQPILYLRLIGLQLPLQSYWREIQNVNFVRRSKYCCLSCLSKKKRLGKLSQKIRFLRVSRSGHFRIGEWHYRVFKDTPDVHATFAYSLALSSVTFTR